MPVERKCERCGAVLASFGADALCPKSAMAAELQARERFLDEMQALMTGNGLAIDDRTTLQKLAELDKMTILSEGKDFLSAVQHCQGAGRGARGPCVSLAHARTRWCAFLL